MSHRMAAAPRRVLPNIWHAKLAYYGALSLLIAASLLSAAPACAQPPAGPIRILAAENFYGDVARQIGGRDVTVASILTNPEQDPHLFEVSPAVGRAVSGARIVIYSGIGYDPWMPRMLAAARAPGRHVIDVAALIGRKAGDNPHIWYDPATMPALAHTLADLLIAEDPAHQAGYRARLATFDAAMAKLRARIATLRQRLAGTPVTATEPVFGEMFKALGMVVRNRAFQLAVMNGTEPSAAAIGAFEHDLRARKVALLVYNSQATSQLARRMADLARASGIPVVGATETEPPGTLYQAWMQDELTKIAQALPTTPLPATRAAPHVVP